MHRTFTGSSRLCVIIFAYGIVKCLLGKTFRTILRIFYQYRPRFHTETRRADTLITESYPSYTDPLWGPLAGTSPAYTFTGYRVTSVSGTYTDESITYPIVGLLPVGSIVSAAGDQIPHSPTDNLFNPDGGFAPDFPLLPVGDTFRKFSFGGIAFNIQEGTLIEPYQVFARSDFNSTWSNPPGFSDYAGCPGSCVGVVEVVPEPTSTLSLLALGTLGAASTLKRKLKPSQSTEKETTKVS